MRVLFISNYFPPEVNAPATRLYEQAKVWVQDGHAVEVLTSNPNFPEGKVYGGYQNRFRRELVHGIHVTRVPMYVTANEGIVKRTLSYISFMLSICLYAGRLQMRPDVVVATSPQFFAALGGYFVARMLRVPFVLEIRDLWPESIVAVGAVRRSAIIRFFERLEQFLYERSTHIVVVTDSFKRFIVGRGIAPQKISVIKNGADLDLYNQELDPKRLEALRRTLGLEGKFVASYIGTIGMAHRADIMLEAAELCDHPDIVFMVVGTGAERVKLKASAAERNRANFMLLDKQPKEVVRYLLALSDASVIHLRASPLFRTVIPSKVFESMAMKRPIVLGVEGETREIIEAAGAGIAVEPENAAQLVAAVKRLYANPDLAARMGCNGYTYLCAHHDRQKLARAYWTILRNAARKIRPARNYGRAEPVTELVEADLL
jgi:colanic acid biosynthesis glycosyl transferase WcaI